jgi:hypothetical protein
MDAGIIFGLSAQGTLFSIFLVFICRFGGRTMDRNWEFLGVYEIRSMNRYLLYPSAALAL